MTTREFLSQYKKIRYSIENLEREIEELEARITSIKSTIGDGMPRGSASHNQTEILIATLVDKKREKEGRLIAAEELRLEIETVIDMVDDPIFSRLLKDRYIKGMNWISITIDLGLQNDDYVRGKLRRKAETAASAALVEFMQYGTQKFTKHGDNIISSRDTKK